MIKIGLTGSIGMGKSTAARVFVQNRVPVFDADAQVHKLQGRGGALVNQIEARFPGTTGEAGVNRAKLGAIVIGNARALADLEAIVHPAVGKARAQFLARHRSRPMVVLDIPLLFEKRGQHSVDLIVTVSARAWQQRKRVLSRPGMTAEKFARIKALQTPDAIKRARSHVVIDTGGLRRDTAQAVRALIACVRAQTRR